MAINANREQARLNITTGLVNALKPQILAKQGEIVKAVDGLLALDSTIKLNESKIAALFTESELAVQRISLVGTPGEMPDYDAEADKQQIAAAKESVFRLKVDNALLAVEVVKMEGEKMALQRELVFLEGNSLFTKLASQEAALAKKEATYPQKLARHLRKCKRLGWADPRLAAASKKK